MPPLRCALSRGAGTSLAGQCCNVAVVLDFTNYMNRIIKLYPRWQFARVQPGVLCDTLRSFTRPDTRGVAAPPFRVTIYLRPVV